MNTTNDGGNAFPWGGDITGGMSLRDYFAAKALNEMLSRPVNGIPISYLEHAQDAYTYADAMLVAREESYP